MSAQRRFVAVASLLCGVALLLALLGCIAMFATNCASQGYEVRYPLVDWPADDAGSE